MFNLHLDISMDERSDRRIAKRGFVEEDIKWFSDEAVLKLQTAQEELEWLLNRGYKTESVINLIGGRYQFSARQRNALQRSTASAALRDQRKIKMLPYEDAKDGEIYIDGFNLIITLEVAFSGGVLVIANDGTIRDIAGLRGTYSLIDKTEKALNCIGKVLEELRVPRVKFLLDAPVSNSGRLKCRILEHASQWRTDVEVELVPNADHILFNMERVVSSDSIILDKCISWFNISKKIVEEYVGEARVVNLSGNRC